MRSMAGLPKYVVWARSDGYVGSSAYQLPTSACGSALTFRELWRGDSLDVARSQITLARSLVYWPAPEPEESQARP